VADRYYDWKYRNEPEPFIGGRHAYHARGKVLGGSSSINGMIFQRGNSGLRTPADVTVPVASVRHSKTPARTLDTIEYAAHTMRADPHTVQRCTCLRRVPVTSR